jgi:hypothetical protein
MTPNNHVHLKDSIQLQTAVRMFLEYLLEHKALLQTVMQKQQATDGDSAPAHTWGQQTENISVVMNDFNSDTNAPGTR